MEHTAQADNNCICWVVGILLLVLAAALSVPVFRYSMIMDDQAAWYFMSKVWVQKGIPPYAGIIAENKPPGIFLVFAISNIFSGVNYIFSRILAAVLLLGGGYALAQFARKYIGGMGAVAALATYAMLLLWARTDADIIDYPESYLIAFSLFAFWSYSQPTRKRAFLSGMLMGCALLFKQTAVFPFLTLVFWSFISRQDSKFRAVYDSMLMVAGACSVNVVILLFLLSQGSSLAEYMNWVWLFAADYETFSYPLEMWVAKFFTAWHPWLIFAPILLLFIFFPDARQSGRQGIRRLLSIWILCDMTAISISGHFYAPQFKQIIPSLALMSGYVIQVLAEKTESLRCRFLPHMIVVLAVLCLCLEVRVIPYDSRHSDYVIVGGLANRLTRGDELVFVPFQFEIPGGIIQVYSGRYSPLTYFRSYWRDPGVDQLRMLTLHPPELIIFQGLMPIWLRNYISENKYRFAFNWMKYNFYSRDLGRTLERLAENNLEASHEGRRQR